MTTYVSAVLRRLRTARQLSRLRRKCKERLDRAGAWDIPTLQQRLTASRGRPILVIPMPISVLAVNGMWLSTSSADLVLYEANTSAAHQQHIIAHELAHILCEHRSVGDGDTAVLHRLFPDIAPEVINRILLRTEYSDANECEAEMTASLLLAPVNATPVASDQAAEAPAAPDDVAARLRSAIVEQPLRNTTAR